MNKKLTGKSRGIVLVFIGLFGFFGVVGDTVFERLQLEVNGTVIASRDEPSKAAPRYATYYTLRGDDGKQSEYVAGATDASLERSLPAGTRISKKAGALGYWINGRRVDFPLLFYTIPAFFSLLALFLGLRQFLSGR